MNWVLLSFIALTCFSIMVTLITMLSRGGLPVSFILFGLSVVLTIFYFIQTFITTKFGFAVDTKTLLFLLIIGVLSGIGNWAQFQAARDAPNPGLAIAIVGMQAGLIAILAMFYLKDKITALQAVGIGVGIFAILLISVGAKH
jgi:drug/metabolite transporter (DMT)-like permease